ncbi:serine hydrolase domain-containing protein [Cryptosporangium minutisporangium]|uniref:Serine hydrolase n=1 Tax=Cryptosporangium minutisporangium TaxID=113569 RepID=A0ABP6TDN5_9ACTN
MTERQLRSVADLGLFTGAPQHDHFARMHELVPTSTMAAAAEPSEWPHGDPVELPEAFDFDGRERPTSPFLVETDTAALLVLADGVVRHETYRLTGGPDVRWLSMSVAKSFVSALVGIAVAEGHITGVDEAISTYVPVQPASAYDGVSIRDVLRMSSGARWNEDYSDPTSDVFVLNAAVVGVGTLDEFVASMAREHAPGTLCRYNSGDTQVLGALVARATGRSLTDYMREKLVEPLGMGTGHWLVDGAGTEVAYGGLNLTARDYATLGELYRYGGRWRGRQIVPAAWVTDSTTVAAPHLAPGQPVISGERVGLGYGYQWWLPDGDRGEFAAIGVYNQFVHVDPVSRTTIVKLSANRAYGTSTAEATNREMETLAFLRAVARHVGRHVA